MPIYKDFIGLNLCIYDPCETDVGSFGPGTNTLGYSTPNLVIWKSNPTYWYDNAVGSGNVGKLTNAGPEQVLPLLNLHRNGPWGYGSWKQVRVSNNHLSRYQKRNNIFTYVEEPGVTNIYTTSDLRTLKTINKYGPINTVVEPVICDSYKPLVLLGKMTVINPRSNMANLKSVQIKSTFGNETTYYANDSANRYHNTIEMSDENYDQLKDLYLENGLADDASALEEFNFLNFEQTIFPKMQYSYLNKTRSRTFYKSLFWKDFRGHRTVSGTFNATDTIIPSQSIWPLDPAGDWATRAAPSSTILTPTTDYTYQYYIGGGEGNFNFDTGTRATVKSLGGSGQLMNSYSQICIGRIDDYTSGRSLWQKPTFSLTASAYYSRKVTLVNRRSFINPAFPPTKEMGTFVDTTHNTSSIPTASLFTGDASWDVLNNYRFIKNDTTLPGPEYNSYQQFASNTRLKGQGYSIIPEYRISSHVEKYISKGVTEEIFNIFELSGATSTDTTTQNDPTFYKTLSNSDFMKHFDLIINDHRDFTKPSILTLKCKAIKKFLAYDGFYPAQRTLELANQFLRSNKDYIAIFSSSIPTSEQGAWDNFGKQPVITPLFAPGVLFNTIKAGVACDYPMIDPDHLGTGSFTTSGVRQQVQPNDSINFMITGSQVVGSGSNNYDTIFDDRIPFEALADPERYIARKTLSINEPHAWSGITASIESKWSGDGDLLYRKMANNFLAEVPTFFLKNENFTTISSLESSHPDFGNAISGNFYAMRVKMNKTRKTQQRQWESHTARSGSTFSRKRFLSPPQDIPKTSLKYVQESITMYSRPSAFGPPSFGCESGSISNNQNQAGSDSLWGFNYPYTPPYYHGDAYCDLIFECKESKKYNIDEIIDAVKEYPYYTRFYYGPEFTAFKDLAAQPEIKTFTADNLNPYTSKYEDYDKSPWYNLIRETPFNIAIVERTKPQQWNVDSVQPGQRMEIQMPPSDDRCGPQHPAYVNYNAMQLDSSINLFGKAYKRNKRINDEMAEVFTEGTVQANSQWTIQTKFETPILNFNDYTDLNKKGCTSPLYASGTVPRGMWHQYGEIPSGSTGIYLNVGEIPFEWLNGALLIPPTVIKKKVKSLAKLVGFESEAKKLGQIADVKQISEAVVAVPFVEKDNEREFYTIPRADIDNTIEALRREVGPGEYVLGGPPKVGNTIIHMCKMMKKYIFPPSMDFIKYSEIQPFAMYIFEFNHNLDREDLQNIWQGLPPKIGASLSEAEATISHELLAHELLGGGAVIKNNKLDENAEGLPLNPNIRWMMFKVKKRAVTDYFEKVVRNTGIGSGPALALSAFLQKEKEITKSGGDASITYNWPYDFFSLVELVKIDSQVTFADIENDDKGNKSIKPINKGSREKIQSEKQLEKNVSMAKGKSKK